MPKKKKRTLSERSLAWALKQHKKSGHKKRYQRHLPAVVEALEEFGEIDEKVRAAAYLHDVIEDTSRDLDDIRKRFGKRVARMVDFCTDARARSRRRRKERTRRKWTEIRTRYQDADWVLEAIRIKVADRIANVRHRMAKGQRRKLRGYVREHPEFRRVLWAFDPTHEAMWEELDELIEEAEEKLAATKSRGSGRPAASA